MEKVDYTHLKTEDINSSCYKTIMICNFNLGKDLIIFPSDDSMKDYCKAIELQEGSEEYNLILQKQYNGQAMPLFEVKFNNRKGFGYKKFVNIDKFVPVPWGSNRLFDRRKDRYTFCAVYKSSGKKYKRYTFKFEPDPEDLSKNFETCLFYHKKAHVGDIPRMRKEEGKFRWILTNKYPRQRFTYSFFKLDSGQLSMTDNMDTSKMELDPKNDLIKNRPWMDKTLHSPNEIATLVHLFDNHGTFKIHRTALLRIHKSCYLNGLESDSIHSLSMEELVIICTSIAPKYSSEKKTKTNETLQNLNKTHYTLTLVV